MAFHLSQYSASIRLKASPNFASALTSGLCIIGCSLLNNLLARSSSVHLISKSASARERMRALLGYFSKAPCYWNKWFAAAAARFFSESRLLFSATQLFVLYFFVLPFRTSVYLLSSSSSWERVKICAKQEVLFTACDTHTHNHRREQVSERVNY